MVIPVRIRDFRQEQMGAALVYFPVVGLLIGLFLALVSSVLILFGLPQVTVSIAVVVALAAVTGGMHLDGVADTADAFFSGKNKDEMLAIMRDPRVGALGVVSICCVLLSKVGLVNAFPAARSMYPLILMGVLSRWSLVMAMFIFPYARREGRASSFMQGMSPARFWIATVTALVCAVMIGKMQGACCMAVTAVSTYIAGRRIQKKIGGITGDTLGAVCEMNEIIILFSAVVTNAFLYR